MKKINILYILLFIMCITPLMSQEAPDHLVTTELAKITKVEFNYDPGWGEHEFDFFIVYPFSEREGEFPITVCDKTYFVEVMKWRVGDFIYIDRVNVKAYNLSTKKWAKLCAIDFL